jgi:uncharacterized membrane protein YjgN (DUF898 family)
MNQEIQVIDHKLKFVGNGVDLLVLMIKNVLLTFITLGIYYSWAKVDVIKFFYSNTDLDGNRFRFHGTGKELFFGMLKAIGIIILIELVAVGLFFLAESIHTILLAPLVLIVIVGVYFFLGYAFYSSKRYRYSRTSYREIRFRLEGNKFQFAIGFVKALLATVVSLGFLGGYLNHFVMNFMYNKLSFGSAKFSYTGSKSKLINSYAKDWFLTIITLFIYSFWMQMNLYRYMLNNTSINGAKLKTDIQGGDYFALIFVNMFLTLVTFGIAIPWVQIRVAQFFLKQITIDGNLDLDSIVQSHQDNESATGEGMMDGLDAGFDLGL